MATVVIIDDDASVREVVTAYLERDGHTVFSAGDAASAVGLFERVRPALVVLDLMLPDGSGVDLCRQLRERSDMPVLMLTARSTEDDVVEGLAVGADDYLTKPFSPRELVARVNAALRRSAGRTAPLVSLVRVGDGGLEIDTVHGRVTLDGELVELTGRQLQLLLILARYPGRVYSRHELLELMDDGAGDDREQVRVVDAHIKNLRRRIERDSHHPSFVQTVHGMGYRLAQVVK